MREAPALATNSLSARVIAIIFALCLLTGIVYRGVGSHDFVEFDDTFVVRVGATIILDDLK